MMSAFRGRAWCFGDRVNTDDMYPATVMSLPIEAAARHMFDSSRPGWPELVRPGDVVVGGSAFGIGSSRPVALLFRALGVSCVLADGFNSLFERNCINYGLAVLAVPGVSAAVIEGETVDIDLENAVVTTADGRVRLQGRRYPDLVLQIIREGGLVKRLRNQGLLKT